MNCPNCNETLIMADRQGIEIDYCPKCRGVWLDRGELDKIIERTAGYEPPKQQPENYTPDQAFGKQQTYPNYQSGHPHKKKKGFMSEFFDFD